MRGGGWRGEVTEPRSPQPALAAPSSVVFRAEMVAGYVSLLTAYRPGASGYVVERNTRYPAHKGGNREMLDNLLDGVPARRLQLLASGVALHSAPMRCLLSPHRPLGRSSSPHAP